MEALPYIFRLNRTLLEVDAVETDATLRWLLGERRQAILQDASGREVLCAVEPGGGAISGRGLGRFFRRFTADLLGIVPLAPGQEEGGEPFRFRIVELPLLQPGPDGAAPPTEPPSGPNLLGDLWERFRKGAFESESAAELHQASLRLSMTPGFDELISLDLLPFTPFAHQVRAVQQVLQRMRGRALLCDEVGLGKTIEAGIVLMEYMLRGLARRVLVLVPPSLVEQWTEELRTKFRLDFIAYDDPVFRQAPDGWARFERVVASVDTAKREPHASAISSIDYDMVIVDEAHHLRNRETLAWKLVNRLRKRYILLLTATPVQNDLEELFNLITLLRPGQLRTPAEFRRRYVAKGDRLRPSNVEELRRLVREVMIRNRRAEAGLRLPPRPAVRRLPNRSRCRPFPNRHRCRCAPNRCGCRRPKAGRSFSRLSLSRPGSRGLQAKPAPTQPPRFRRSPTPTSWRGWHARPGRAPKCRRLSPSSRASRTRWWFSPAFAPPRRRSWTTSPGPGCRWWATMAR